MNILNLFKLPDVMQVNPIRCSISQWNGCWKIQNESTRILRYVQVYFTLTAKIGGSRLRSMGFMMMKTCWFLWVRPVSSLRAALQKYWTQPCFPRKVDGRPRGRPSLNGKLWIPAESKTDSPPEKSRKFSFFHLKYQNLPL